jgi:hypothetical protein
MTTNEEMTREDYDRMFFEYLEKGLSNITIKKQYYNMTVNEKIDWICKSLHILLSPYAEEQDSFSMVEKEDYMDDLYLLQLTVKTKETNYLIPYFSLLTYVKALIILEKNITHQSFWDMALDEHDSYLDASVAVFKLILEGISTIED